MSEVFFSIIMATYNSEKTIEKALKSIRNQEFEQNEIEILVIDGGSSDNTKTIAKKYGAVIIDNPVRLPEPAKIIGLKNATGKYICIMDSDEEISNTHIFKQRKRYFEENKDIKCLAIGLNTPKQSDPCCYYINAVGDPFTCFVYRTYKDSMEGLIKRIGDYNEIIDSYTAKYEKNDIRPIGDSGTIMKLDYIKKNYWNQIDSITTATIFDMIIRDTRYVGYINKDNHNHYTEASFSVFLKKLKFRIINNIFDIEGSGYANKAEKNRKLSRRKYLFPFYTLSVVIPIIDGIRMTINYKHWIFLLHILFCWYVMLEIVIQYSFKLIGVEKKNKSYAK